MKTLDQEKFEQVNGGWSDDNNNTFSTVVRHAGKGAIIGGATGGPKAAAVGAAIGALSGFSAAAGNN